MEYEAAEAVRMEDEAEEADRSEHEATPDRRGGVVDFPVPSPAPDPGTPVDERRLRALTITEAALAVGRHESTLRRYMKAEQFPNAYRGPDDVWLIPVADLLDKGLLPRSSDADPPGIVAGLEEENERLRQDIADLRRRLAAAEALSEERAERIRELGLSIRALIRTAQPEAVEARSRAAAGPLVWSGEIALKDV